MSLEKLNNGKSASELAEKVKSIKEKIEYYEEKKKDNSLTLEREKAKHEMYISQLKELGYSFEGIDEEILKLSKEVEDAINEAESICKEAGINL